MTSAKMYLRAVNIVHAAHEHDNHWDLVALGFIKLFRETDPKDFDEEAFRAVVGLAPGYNKEWSK